MQVETIQNAIAEAERFVRVAKKVKIIHDRYANGKPWFRVKDYTKESAACKRASLDLTSALVEMRKP